MRRLSRRAPQRRPLAGTIVDESGQVLGRHGGIHRYTDRPAEGARALSASDRTQWTARTPLYVLALRPADRQVVVGSRGALERTTLDRFSGELDF